MFLMREVPIDVTPPPPGPTGPSHTRNENYHTMLWDLTGSYTCVVILVWKSYFPEILDAMKSLFLILVKCSRISSGLRGLGSHQCLLELSTYHFIYSPLRICPSIPLSGVSAVQLSPS